MFALRGEELIMDIKDFFTLVCAKLVKEKAEGT